MVNTVSIQNLTHRYGHTLALDDVSLDIVQGTTVGLIGPDGVGKSTLLSLIAGVRVIQSGQVTVLGGNMAHADTRLTLSHRIAYMPQGLGQNLYPTLTVYENIEFHARLFGLTAQQRRQRILRLLQATALSPFQHRAAGKLSGGMKQKLSLCCALVHQPDLLILDEPTTGVDPLSRRQFWALVANLRREIPKMTVVVATAYIDEAQQFEQLIAMDAGRVLVNQPTRQVLQTWGVNNLEAAYIKLLPENKQQGADDVHIPPFEPLANTPPVMEAHGLTKKFGDFVSVDDVSFTIAKGEIFGFLGANGCGKSTTMKMLTGLLEPTSGTAALLGQPIDSGSLNTKKRVGYMSQAFSLYEELTVRQNLDLHAKLYAIPQAQHAIEQSLRDFDLSDVVNVKPADLPLGIRQRLQLAAACLHQPEVLILDEPTSGVDPAARNRFWRKLAQLSREQRMTIFVSTHFMNEVALCDRVSMMNRGRVLAVGTPSEILRWSGQDNIEEAFIHYLQKDFNDETSTVSGSLKTEGFNKFQTVQSQTMPPPQGFSHFKPALPPHSHSSISAVSGSKTGQRHVWAYGWNAVFTFALRESRELLRDKIRLFFALLGPAILLASLGWTISFDVSHLTFTVIDRDQSYASRQFVSHFSGSAYFVALPESPSDTHAQTLLQRNQAALVLEIPPDFGRDLAMGRQPEIGVWVDGAAPFNGNSVEAYVQALTHAHNVDVLRQRGITLPESMKIVPRYMYNQDFRSVNSMVPSVMMLVLVMIPAIMSALAVVRERELGSIQNLYASPARVPQYLLGKQLPYVAMGAVNFILLWAMAIFWFDIPMTGSFGATLLGAMLLVWASTALGLLISSFTQSQTAAFFLSALGTMAPAVNFSGLIYPVSSMSGGAKAIGLGFPASWFGTISKGGFNKGLGFNDFYREYMMLMLFCAVYFGLACVFLKKQEK